jgi:hypothetical protein
MNVELIKENEDGSASYSFDLTKEEAESLLRHGILEAIKAGIREGDKLKVDGEDVKEWQGLTDEEIEQEFGFIDELLRDCVQRTEAKLKEKNA